MKHYNITVSGKVQGVGFRFTAMEMAYRYNIRGYVKNTPENTVYIEAEGAEPDMDRFLSWCRKGPVGAKVSDVGFSEGPVVGYTEFSVSR